MKKKTQRLKMPSLEEIETICSQLADAGVLECVGQTIQARKQISCECDICALYDYHLHSRRGVEIHITQQVFAWTRLMFMSPNTDELYSLRSYLEDSRKATKTGAEAKS